MSKKQVKQSFLHGAAVLAVATAIVKVIGAIYKIPLQRVIGTDGYTHFMMAYDIFNVLQTISTAGLPVAMSKMISEASTLGRYNQVRRIYRVALYTFLVVGILGTALMLGFSKQLAVFMEDPDCWYSIMALAPAVLFICIMSSFRGYFQGQSYMTPTAVSQIIEAMSKLFVGLGCAYLLMRMGFGQEIASGGAIFGVTVGTALGAGYMFVRYLSSSRSETHVNATDKPDSFKQTMNRLLSLAVPITIGASSLQIINLVDSKVVMGQLQNAVGFSYDTAKTIFGTYSLARTVFNLPAAFIIPITVSVIPSISSQLALGNHTGARRVEESAMRITALLSLPCGVGLSVLATPIMGTLYKLTPGELQMGGQLLMILGVTVVFNCVVLLTNSILQAHGKVNIPIFTMLVGGVIKVILNYVLVGNPALNINGAPIGTFACYLTISALNVYYIRRSYSEKPKTLKLFVKPLFASAAMGVAAYMAYDVLSTFLPSFKLACFGAIAVAVLVYVIFVVILRIITYDDCMLLPKGDKIAKILRIR